MELSISEIINTIISKLESWLNTFIEYLPNFALAFLVLFMAYFIAKYVNTLTYKLVSRQVQQESVSQMISKISAIVLVLIGLYIALGILNLSKTLTSLLATAGVAGLAIGLALQNTLSNTVAGIALSFRKKIQIGNWVETNGYAGEVIDINLKEFVIKEADNNIVVLPNKLILENPLKNYSLTTKMRVALECGVAYESDLEEVEKLTKATIANTFEQVNGPEAVEFYYTEFGDSSINYLCRFWIDAESMLEKLKAKTKAIIEIKKAYNEKGISIPFPIRTLQFDNKLSFDDTALKKQFSNN
ncbi:mechanosensitive ion channel family protein [Tamlana fucoidanivorans]|uniref:Mechanosensitive ion channel family protein n=1 Tax=Allotamlana fucoidanivorans TaxID=2583814 RepID=A0A5C4SQ81_9FLAO|nr:mechanosensitive ion channel family protein [Tamlana fucoidanivorans]TNJ46422.1 mechanosensitive ion channel family protein [Tamlana fucoidanivorans]